jgi:NDP-sugar pyrophosphorylase family protein
MIPLLGVPMIEWNLARFLEFGVNRFFINLHYLPDVLRDYLGDGSRWGATISYHYEPQILGTAGGVKSFEDQLEDEFFVIYGDIFSQVDYHAMEEAWQNYNGALGMQRVRYTENYADADVVEVDDSKRVIAVHAKPHTAIYPKAYRMAGIFILNRQILSVIPKGIYSEIGRDMIPAVVKSGGEFRAYVCDDYSKGIDTIGKKEEVELYLREHGLTQPVSVTSPDGKQF